MPSSRVDPVPIAVLGGSSAFLPSLATAMVDLADDLPPLEVRLFGQDKDRTSAVAHFCSLHAQGRGVEHRYVACTDLEVAVSGAPLVVNQVRIGGFDGRSQDERLALEFGFPGDETIGPGGLAAAIRATGPILDMARVVERTAKDAWFVQVANPMSMLLASVIEETGLRTFGLCELPDHTLAEALALVDWTGPVETEYVGVNHQGWFLRVEDAGHDLLGEIFDRVAELENGGFFRVDASLMREYGALPLPYLRLLLHQDRELVNMRTREEDRGQQLAALANELYAHYARTDDPELPQRLRERSMPWNAMTIAPVLTALLGGPPAMAYVSDPNAGHLPFLPDDAIVEKRATVTAEGLEAAPYRAQVQEIHPAIVSLLESIGEFERLGARAARRGDHEAAMAALRAHPYEITESAANRMLARMFHGAKRLVP
jgi:6-phospho-beta-glucosidase